MVWAYIRIKEMCLKKSALLTMILMLILAGCGNKKIVVHEYAKDYLNLIKGSDCIIDSYDMKAIKDIHLECLEPDLLSIIEKIRQEQFVETVQCTLKKENKAAENDLIELKLSFPEDQSEKTSVQKLYVVCSDDGTSFPVLQKELVGKEVGYEGVVSDTREGYRKTLPSGEILFVVENIYNCDFFPAYVDSLKYSNVYTIAQFYDYMIAMRVNEKVFDLRFQFRQDFLSECLKNCRFSYSNDQIEAIAEKKAREYLETANNLGLSLDDYWEFFCENAIGAHLEEDPYTNSVVAAEREVGTVLFVGAMAEKMGITVSDDEVQEAFDRTNLSEFQISPSWNTKVKIRYDILQDKVIAAFVPEYANDYIH